MTATTTQPTIRDLLTFIHENPGSDPVEVAQEFNIDRTDCEEILSSLDQDDGTLYEDGAGYYRVEDQESSLDDVLKQHKLGGGRSLDDILPVGETKPKPKAKTKAPKSQKGGKVSTATAAKPKTEAKAKPKAKTTKKPAKAKTPKVETPTEETIEKTKPAAKAKPKAKAARKPKAKAKAEMVETKPKKTAKGKTKKKATRKSKGKVSTTADVENPSEPKVKKTRVVKPRASRVVEDKVEAKKLGVSVGTEVKMCVDCHNVYDKYGGEFRPRWTDAEKANAKNPGVKASPRHVQPRCIDCDKLRSKRKSRFTGLRRAVAVEDIGDAESIITHPDRKRGGVPDGKFSVALVNDTGDGFTPTLRGVLVSLAEGLIKLRWASGDSPEILGATKTAIKAVKAPKVVAPAPKPKATPKPKAKTKAKLKPKAKTPKAKAPAKAKTPAKKKGKLDADGNPW